VVHEWYYVYMMQSSSRRALYIGVTNSLERRIHQPKTGAFEGFTADYHACRLVYFERYGDIRDAIAREKQLKGWRREKKDRLVEKMNPAWRDLSADWGKPIERPKWAVRDPLESEPSE
jgi:putative endonuclease